MPVKIIFSCLTLILTTSIFFLSCKNKNIVPVDKPVVNSLLERFYFEDSAAQASDNSLVFVYDKRFDTSFVLHLIMNKSGIAGNYYQVLPQVHSGMEEVVADNNKFLFFEGVGFELNMNNSDSLKTICSEIEQEYSIKPPFCFDCPSYTLLYAGKEYHAADSAVFGKLISFLDRNVFAGIEQVRGNFNHRPK